MKNLMLIALFSMSASALACPNLAGTYSCKNSQDGTYKDVTVNQTATKIEWDGDEGAKSINLQGQHKIVVHGHAIFYEVSCTKDKMFVEISEEKKPLSFIKMAATAKGMISSALSSYEAKKLDCTRK